MTLAIAVSVYVRCAPCGEKKISIILYERIGNTAIIEVRDRAYRVVGGILHSRCPRCGHKRVTDLNAPS